MLGQERHASSVAVLRTSARRPSLACYERGGIAAGDTHNCALPRTERSSAGAVTPPVSSANGLHDEQPDSGSRSAVSRLPPRASPRLVTAAAPCSPMERSSAGGQRRRPARRRNEDEPPEPGRGSPTITGASVSARARRTAAPSLGKVYCWGSNSKGQLRQGTTTDSASPVEVSGITTEGRCLPATTTAARCSPRNDRVLGRNSAGQLGNGSTTDSTTAVAVGSITGAKAVAAGYDTAVLCFRWDDQVLG